ncbi:MAG: hypothetical protein B6245_14020 [Desulfobacteraceae bacterium 4572_88]|nr:MAG: hypothetical protein B6245_14020 [Desulfobacteraceae bacterium 4572_88]
MKKICFFCFKPKAVFVFGFLAFFFATYPLYSVSALSQTSSEKHALLIGISDYKESGFKNLQGTKNDAKLINNVLIARFGFKPENITTLLDEEATHTGIKAAFRKLSDTIAPGSFVYIHYSGHGSQTCDLNGDERWGRDSTWVPYVSGSKSGKGDQDGPGTRSLTRESSGKDCSDIQKSLEKEMPSLKDSVPDVLNGYDVLDDEINEWLTELNGKTDQVVFVSDSCHSGTVTRGEKTETPEDDALMVRGISGDYRPHPLGTRQTEKTPLSGTRITACRDDEKAHEYLAENNKIYGVFTWFWAKSLEAANPGETWKDAYKRTCARIRYEGKTQHPQFEGEDREIFGKDFPEKRKTISIRSVSADGKTAKIDVGKLLGATQGSVYRREYDPQAKAPQDLPDITITKVNATWSQGDVTGKFEVGDLVVLEHYQHDTAPMKLFVRADSEKDLPVLGRIQDDVKKGKCPAYEITDNQKESDLVIQILRPRKDDVGNHIYESPVHSLPQSFENESPECWILTPSEKLYQEKLKLPIADIDKGLNILYENLTKIAGMQNLLKLDTGTGTSHLQLNITLWRELASGEKPEKTGSEDGWPDMIEADGKTWQKEETVVAKESEETDLKTGGKLLTFSINNPSDKSYYTYLINIMPDGKILPFYPAPFQSKEDGLVKGNSVRKIEEATLLIRKLGKDEHEYVRLIASLQPLDIYVLEQKSFATKGADSLTPLEALLAVKAGVLRGEPAGPISTAAWSTVQGAFFMSGE